MTLRCETCEARVSRTLAGFHHGCPYCPEDWSGLVSDDESAETDDATDGETRRVEA